MDFGLCLREPSFITKTVTFVELAGVMKYDTNTKLPVLLKKEIPQQLPYFGLNFDPHIFFPIKKTPLNCRIYLPSSSDFCHSYPARPNKRSTIIMASGLKKLSLGASTESRGQTSGFPLVDEPTRWKNTSIVKFDHFPKQG